MWPEFVLYDLDSLIKIIVLPVPSGFLSSHRTMVMPEISFFKLLLNTLPKIEKNRQSATNISLSVTVKFNIQLKDAKMGMFKDFNELQGSANYIRFIRHVFISHF